jgi:hypothetical protein
MHLTEGFGELPHPPRQRHLRRPRRRRPRGGPRGSGWTSSPGTPPSPQWAWFHWPPSADSCGPRALDKSAGRADDPARVAAAASYGWAEYWVLLGLAAAAAVSLAVLALALNRIARQVKRGVDPKTRARAADHLLTTYQLHVDLEMLPMILGR